ncbi:MAG: Do family serine endopeptidase [Nitrospinaceae bacterium]|jgi:serine protease Do|nr:MAG: Do family serine endopeptidase [Nitrospinaceae bacterium]
MIKKKEFYSISVFAAAFFFAVFAALGAGSGLSPALAQAASEAGALPGNTNFIVDIAKNQTKAVVNVSVQAKIENAQHFQSPGRPFPFAPNQDPRFGAPGPRLQKGMGTGFVIDREGLILTNHHVVDGAENIKVRFQDDREYGAVLVGSDPKTDIALIKISDESGASLELPFLTLGDSDALQVGEWVVAIGNPFGLNHTVTAGIVSAKHRNIGSGPYDEFIQTDASINPGNSGGPLLNSKGEVVGINTAIFSGNAGGNIGIGFAVPINLAKSILEELKESGKVTRGWLGVMVQKLTPELAQAFKLNETRGALVGNVVPGSPADKGGIRRGDVIVGFAGKDVDRMEALPKLVAAIHPGDEVRVDVLREGEKKRLNIVIAVLEEKET